MPTAEDVGCRQHQLGGGTWPNGEKDAMEAQDRAQGLRARGTQGDSMMQEQRLGLGQPGAPSDHHCHTVATLFPTGIWRPDAQHTYLLTALREWQTLSVAKIWTFTHPRMRLES